MLHQLSLRPDIVGVDGGPRGQDGSLSRVRSCSQNNFLSTQSTRALLDGLTNFVVGKDESSEPRWISHYGVLTYLVCSYLLGSFREDVGLQSSLNLFQILGAVRKLQCSSRLRSVAKNERTTGYVHLKSNSYQHPFDSSDPSIREYRLSCSNQFLESTYLMVPLACRTTRHE